MSSRSSVDRAPTRCSGGHGFDSCFSFVPRSCHPTSFPGSLFSAREAEKRDWERGFVSCYLVQQTLSLVYFFLRFQSRVHNSTSFRVLYNFSGILRTFINGNLVLIHNLANHPVQWNDVKFIWSNSYLYCGCRWKWRVVIAVNFPI